MSSAQKSNTQRSVQKSSIREKSDRLDYRQVFKEILYFVSEQESIVESLRCILCEYQDFQQQYQVQKLSNDLNEDQQRKEEVDKKMRRNQLYDNGEKKGQIVKQMVNFYTKRNPEKNKRLELCYTSDHIGVIPENIIKFYRKPIKKCDHHPDQYEKHDLAIAQIHKHQVQSDKINLALRKDFTLQDFFSYFDLGRKTFITRDDVYTFFENFIFDDSIEVDVDIFMRRYDRHNNGKISFSDFCDMIVPKEEEIVEVLKKKPTNGLGFQQLTQDTKDLIYSTLQREIEYIDQIQNVLKSLEEIPNYNFYRVFTILDSDDNGFITEEDLKKEFKELKKNSKNKISDKEIQFLISVIDYDEDGQLSYNDFIETFTFYNSQDENEDNDTFNNV
ncbi:hypothetical protein PPERSA_11963 [Pseudocohnilembus persalinus]|uniref:EF-hand domain-containing protein n=1 Tax=Pseudocohnilembus persalinus TaxID=266149 RepID=A0A0V0QK02_PSEPJ|nr:hypothetical protein PPERSA_11963 [Pseudocohnilembus persalinus]|eukprot:KRX02623.1 hypothetical protein PPERSA_11963 [Pseudocohnilembus persalinus]